MTTYDASPHEITDACASVHCHEHHVDEPEQGAYVWCLECGHVYRTAGELRRLYQRAALKLIDRNHPWFRSNEWYPSAVSALWKVLTIRAKDIHFCQHCLHDF